MFLKDTTGDIKSPELGNLAEKMAQADGRPPLSGESELNKGVAERGRGFSSLARTIGEESQRRGLPLRKGSE